MKIRVHFNWACVCNPSKPIKKEIEIYNVFFCFPKKRTSLHGKKGAADHKCATETQDWSLHYERTRRLSENKRYYATNVQAIGACVGGNRSVLQLYRNGCIKIFKTNCNIGNNWLTAGTEVANPNATP